MKSEWDSLIDSNTSLIYSTCSLLHNSNNRLQSYWTILIGNSNLDWTAMLSLCNKWCGQKCLLKSQPQYTQHCDACRCSMGYEITLPPITHLLTHALLCPCKNCVKCMHSIWHSLIYSNQFLLSSTCFTNKQFQPWLVCIFWLVQVLWPGMFPANNTNGRNSSVVTPPI